MEPVKRSLTCEDPVSSQEELYRKGQLQGRINVLSQVLFKIVDNDRAQAIKAEAINYLNDPKSRFANLSLPSKAYQTENFLDDITKAAKAIFHFDEHRQANDLCIRLQNLIENLFEQNACFNIEHLYKIDTDSEDLYEKQGIFDCLRPIIFRAIKNPSRGFPAPDRLPTAYSKMIFEIAMEAEAGLHANTDKFKNRKLVLHSGIKGVKSIEDLGILNKTLPQFQYSTLVFTNCYPDIFYWAAGKGMEYIKDALIAMPNLQTLSFVDIKTPIDERNALVLAEVVLAKEKKKDCAKMRELSFKSSIGTEGTLALLKALRDYKLPLTVIIEQIKPADIERLRKALHLQPTSNYMFENCLEIRFPLLFEPGF